MSKLRGWSRRMLHRFEVDHAVFFTLLTRGWQLATGPVTLVLIARFLTQKLQGYYYTFASLLALQSFVELGLYAVVINIASHEWSKLRLDDRGAIVGDSDALARLVSLGRFVYRWYSVASVVFIFVAGIAGVVTFSTENNPDIHWRGPWLVLIIATGSSLWTMPIISLLEGCNQVATVNRFRLLRGLGGNLGLWVVFALGGGLWAASVSAVAKLAIDLYLLVVRYRRFFEPFRKPPAGPSINWKNEIWPMQWKLGVAGLTNYFIFSLFNPVMFIYHGAKVAGQMGMTLQIVSAAQMLGLAWISAKTPSFGVLVARKEYGSLDHLWKRITIISMAIIVLSALGIWILVLGSYAANLAIAQRVLPPMPTLLLLIATILMQVSQCQTAYILAHKTAPFVAQALIAGSATGLLVWFLGSRFGPTGAAAGYLFVVAAFIIPYETWLWKKCRRQCVDLQYA
jgi:O-antigen/teichoic acid export membrane protein